MADEPAAELQREDPAPGPPNPEAQPIPGALVVADRVGQRICELAALDVGDVVAHHSGVGSLLGTSAVSRMVGGRYPRAQIDMNMDSPRLSLQVALVWPSAVTAVCTQLRSHVADELDRLTGVRPSGVDVQVVALLPRAEVAGQGGGFVDVTPEPVTPEPVTPEPVSPEPTAEGAETAREVPDE